MTALPTPSPAQVLSEQTEQNVLSAFDHVHEDLGSDFYNFESDGTLFDVMHLEPEWNLNDDIAMHQV